MYKAKLSNPLSLESFESVGCYQAKHCAKAGIRETSTSIENGLGAAATSQRAKERLLYLLPHTANNTKHSET